VANAESWRGYAGPVASASSAEPLQDGCNAIEKLLGLGDFACREVSPCDGDLQGASGLSPGGVLITGWKYLNRAIASGEGNGDVVVEPIPVPPLQPPGDGGP
jgi:hypothetical protein